MNDWLGVVSNWDTHVGSRWSDGTEHMVSHVGFIVLLHLGEVLEEPEHLVAVGTVAKVHKGDTGLTDILSHVTGVWVKVDDNWSDGSWSSNWSGGGVSHRDF